MADFHSNGCRNRGFSLIEAMVAMALLLILLWTGLGVYRRHQELLMARSVLTEAMKYKEKADSLVTARGIPKYELLFLQEGWNNPQEMGSSRGFTYYLGFMPCGNGVDCLYVRVRGDTEILVQTLERAQELGMNCNLDLASGVLECRFGQDQ